MTGYDALDERIAKRAQAWNSFLTLLATAKKLGMSFYVYVHDRVSGTYQMPSLAKPITQQAQKRHLGVSWATP